MSAACTSTHTIRTNPAASSHLVILGAGLVPALLWFCSAEGAVYEAPDEIPAKPRGVKLQSSSSCGSAGGRALYVPTAGHTATAAARALGWRYDSTKRSTGAGGSGGGLLSRRRGALQSGSSSTPVSGFHPLAQQEVERGGKSLGAASHSQHRVSKRGREVVWWSDCHSHALPASTAPHVQSVEECLAIIRDILHQHRVTSADFFACLDTDKGAVCTPFPPVPHALTCTAPPPRWLCAC